MRWNARWLVVAGSLAVASSGCYSTWDIAPQSLQNLNGFHEGERRPITTAEGGEVPFDRTTELRFEGATPLAAKFSTVQVEGAMFSGTVRPTFQPVQVDLRQVMSVQARRFNIGKTVVAIVVPVVAVAVLLTVVSVVLYASAINTCAAC